MAKVSGQTKVSFGKRKGGKAQKSRNKHNRKNATIVVKVDET
jgi:hypothetical protein